MSHVIPYLIALLFTVGFAISAAGAETMTLQVPCTLGSGMADSVGVGSEWTEVPTAVGISGDAFMQMWTNAETGTWTILMTYTNGYTCAFATGEDWEVLPLPKPASY